MDESVSDEPKVFEGLFADMLENDFRILHRKEIQPDSSAILFDFSKIENESFRVIGSSARIEETRVTPDALMLHLRAARGIHAFVRIRLPKAPEDLSAADTDGHPVQLCSAWDAETRTLLLDYRSTGSGILVSGSLK